MNIILVNTFANMMDLIIETGEKYDTITDAAESIGMLACTLSRRLSGKYKNNTQLRYA